MKKRRHIKLILVCIILIIFVVIYYVRLVHPIIREYTKTQVNALTEQAINSAVSSVVNTSLNYTNLMNISYNTSGEISYISANQYAINTITREIVKRSQGEIIKIGENAVGVPIGTFTGVSLFNGRGVDVRLNMLPVGVVSSNFFSIFENIGINNTMHQLYLEIITKVKVILPLKSCYITTKHQVFLCESIIVGKVPDVYFEGRGIGNNLNLVP